MRDLPQARVPPADRLLQAARRRQRDGARVRGSRSRAASTPRRPATWRRASPGTPAASASRARSSFRITRPRPSSSAIERLGGRIVKVPMERWWQVLVEHHYPGLEGLFVHPVSDPRRHRRQRHDRPRDPGGPARRGRRARSVGRRRAVVRHRLGAARARAPRRRSSDARSRPRRRSAHRSRPAGPSRSTTRRASWTGSERGGCCPRCGRSPAELIAGSLVVLARRDRRGPAPARRPGPRRRRGRGRHVGGRSPRGPRRVRQGRLRRLRRQHRRRRPRDDPSGRDAPDSSVP